MGVSLWDPLSARGLLYAGAGYVAGESPDGLVTINTTPGARRILIFHRASCQVCGETWSDTDGTYQLWGFDPGQQFDIIGRDWSDTYNDVIVSRVYPYTGPDLSLIADLRFLPGATISTQLVARYGELPYTWTATGLPGWLSMTTGGLLTGTAPGADSSTTITVTCTDAHGSAASSQFQFVVQDTTSAPYWRIYITSGNGSSYVRVIEMQLRATVGGSNLCVGGTASASTSYSGQPASGAFDGLIDDTPGHRWTSSGAALPQWLAYQLTSASKVLEIAICGDTPTSTPSQAINTFTIQSSPDGTTWTDEWTVSGQSTWPAGGLVTFARP